MSIKWEGRNDARRMRDDANELDALRDLRAVTPGAQTVICECCGIVDPCTTNGVCPECRQGMGIGG